MANIYDSYIRCTTNLELTKIIDSKKIIQKTLSEFRFMHFDELVYETRWYTMQMISSYCHKLFQTIFSWSGAVMSVPTILLHARAIDTKMGKPHSWDMSQSTNSLVTLTSMTQWAKKYCSNYGSVYGIISTSTNKNTPVSQDIIFYFTVF